MSSGLPWVLCAALLAAQQAPPQRARPVASLSAYGQVAVDGRNMPTGATVFEGQTVATTAQSTALIVLTDDRTRLALGKASAAEIGAQALRLRSGVGRFVGVPESRALWFASELQLKPDGPATAEATIQPDGQVKVQVDDGAVAVLAPGGSSLGTVSKGQAQIFGRAARRSGGMAPGESPAPGKPVPTAKSGSGGGGAGVWIAIGAAAAGATAVGAVAATKRGS